MAHADSRLHDAVSEADLEALEQLLREEHFDKATLEKAWKLAGERGDVAALRVLRDQAHPQPKRHGEAALRAASSQGHEEAVRFLLACGVSPSARVPLGAPATAYVVTKGASTQQKKKGDGDGGAAWGCVLVVVAACAIAAAVAWWRTL